MFSIKGVFKSSTYFEGVLHFALDKILNMFFSPPSLGVGLCILQLCSDTDSLTSYGVRIIIKPSYYRYYTNNLKGIKVIK